MEVIKETLSKRCLSTPTKPPAKNSNICLSETASQHKGSRKKCKKTNQAAIIQWQRQSLMDKPHRKPWPKSKTSVISKQSPSPLHHTFLLWRARFTAQPFSALLLRIPYRLRLFVSFCESSDWDWMKYTRCERLPLVKAFLFCFNFVVVFSSLENYFGFRTTNVRVKTDRPSAWGGIKRFEHFQRGLSFSDNCAFDLWIDFVSRASPSFARLN